MMVFADLKSKRYTLTGTAIQAEVDILLGRVVGITKGFDFLLWKDTYMLGDYCAHNDLVMDEMVNGEQRWQAYP